MKKGIALLGLTLLLCFTHGAAMASAKTQCYGACNKEYKQCDGAALQKKYEGDKDARNAAKKAERQECEVKSEACKAACKSFL